MAEPITFVLYENTLKLLEKEAERGLLIPLSKHPQSIARFNSLDELILYFGKMYGVSRTPVVGWLWARKLLGDKIKEARCIILRSGRITVRGSEDNILLDTFV